MPTELEPEASPITRRTFLAGAVATVGVMAYAGTHGRHQWEVVRKRFAIANLPDAFVGLRMVQINDLHLEEYTEAWFLEQMVDQVNALDPEIVLIPGDFVSRAPRAIPFAWQAAGLCAEILSTLKAPQRFAVLGNHDAAVGADHVIPPLKRVGIEFLVNSYIPLDRGGDRLWICGTNDATLHPTLDDTLPTNPRNPILLMCHEPDYIDKLLPDPRFASVDLMLSGHSHGGQVRLPLLGPLVLPPLGRKYVEGLFRFGPTQLYVNRGLGTVGLPFRLHCPAEITEITLVRA